MNATRNRLIKRDRDYIYLACLLFFTVGLIIVLWELIINANFSARVLAMLVAYSYSFGYFVARMKRRAKNRIFFFLVMFGNLLPSFLPG